MNKCNPFAFAIAAALAASALAGTASAEVGKKISATIVYSGLVTSSPAFSDATSVALPASYKSKSNVLKVTTSYQAYCSAGDSLRSKVTVGVTDMLDSGLPVDTFDEDAGYQIVTKTYYLVPENMGGPAIPPDAMVTLKLTSQLGTGCSAGSGTMVVEALK
jgi:hypothetical protein